MGADTASGPESWLGLELRHLIALKAIAEQGTFSRAASSLGYTQSAISQQIATLERIVGQRLIDRPGGPRPVSLTEAGELLLRHADAIAARLQAAQADLAALDAGESGPLRIGTYQSVGARILPALLREFSVALAAGRDHPAGVGRRPRADRGSSSAASSTSASSSSRSIRARTRRPSCSATRTCSSSRPARRSRRATGRRACASSSSIR